MPDPSKIRELPVELPCEKMEIKIIKMATGWLNKLRKGDGKQFGEMIMVIVFKVATNRYGQQPKRNPYSFSFTSLFHHLYREHKPFPLQSRRKKVNISISPAILGTHFLHSERINGQFPTFTLWQILLSRSRNEKGTSLPLSFLPISVLRAQFSTLICHI